MGLLRLPEILAALLARFWYINIYYEAAWTDSWCHRHCLHAHQTPLARRNAEKALEHLKSDTTDPEERRKAIQESAEQKLRQLSAAPQ
jgi:hypothetical protein